MIATILRVIVYCSVALLLSALVMCSTAFAATCGTPKCDPLTQPDRTVCGPELGGTHPLGRWRGYWWQNGVENGVRQWCQYRWVCTTATCNPGIDTVLAISDTIASAPTVAEGLLQASQKFGIKGAVGSQADIDYQTLHRDACLSMNALTPWGAPAVYACKTVTYSYKVPPNPQAADQSRPVYPFTNGVRGLVPTSERAAANSPCALSVTDYGTFGPKFLTNRVALCKKP